MKKALIIYYSQTGQLKKILDSVTLSLGEDFDLVFEELKPVPPYPFPWQGREFFQVFPESVQETPCALEPFRIDPDQDFDLIVLAYQVWFLSPSIPVMSFLQTPEAGKILKDRPIITILGVRNMWIMAQERMKKHLRTLGGKLVGNIVFVDPHSNLVSLLTIIRWLMKGEQKGNGFIGRILPPAGVPEKIIREAGKFGEVIREVFQRGQLDELQGRLLDKGAVNINPVLMSIETRGRKLFGLWAKFVAQKGGYGSPAREGRLTLFKYYLFAGVFLVSPFVSLFFWAVHTIFYRKTARVIAAYSNLE